MSIQTPTVSIGLPVYNGENFLRQALDSILAQTFTDFELIISDNASTDCTQEICKEYVARDGRIFYHRNPTNIGAAGNYNLVFGRSVGKYFKWMAHDDLCQPQFLEECVKVLDDNPTVVLCYSSTYLIDGEGKVTEQYSDRQHLRSPRPSQRFREFNRNPGWCNPIFGVIRSKVLKQTPLIGNFSVADRALLAELTLHGEFYEIPAYLFCRRVHSQAYSIIYRSETKSAEWYDPNWRGKLILPRWQRYSAYPKAIRRAPISVMEKLLSFFYLTDFITSRRKWSGILADLLQAIKWGILALFRKSPKGSD